MGSGRFIFWLVSIILVCNISFAYNIIETYRPNNYSDITYNTIILDNNSNNITEYIECNELWIEQINICINKVSIKTYFDENSCNTTNSLPIDNSTLISCDSDFNYNMLYLVSICFFSLIILTIIIVWIFI